MSVEFCPNLPPFPSNYVLVLLVRCDSQGLHLLNRSRRSKGKGKDLHWSKGQRGISWGPSEHSSLHLWEEWQRTPPAPRALPQGMLLPLSQAGKKEGSPGGVRTVYSSNVTSSRATRLPFALFVHLVGFVPCSVVSARVTGPTRVPTL